MPPLISTLPQAFAAAVLAAVLYSFGLATSPPHLTHDEIKFALQAQSIAHTGRDLNGRLLPVYFREAGFPVGRDPICIYVMAAVLRFSPLSEAAIRFSTVLAGAAGVGLVFVLARLIFQRTATAWIVAAILALSPTYYIHSRLALSVIYPVPFTILWLIVLRLYRSRRTARLAAVTGVVLGLGVYSYLAAALMMPLYLLATMTTLALDRDRRGAVIVAAGFAVLMIPLLAWQLVEPERYALIVSSYRLGQWPAGANAAASDPWSLARVSALIDLAWAGFNPSRLFFTGESSLLISTREVGSLLTPVAAFLVIGLATLLARGPRQDAWLLTIGLITAPIPAIVTADVEIRRWLVVLPFMALIAGFAVERLLDGRWWVRMCCWGLVALMVLQFGFFTRDYFGPYRERASVWFGGNIKAALESVLADAAAAQPPPVVYIGEEIPWVEAYWRFYTLVHEQQALLARTRFVRLRAESPA